MPVPDMPDKMPDGIIRQIKTCREQDQIQIEVLCPREHTILALIVDSPSTGPNTMNLTPQPGTNTYGRDLYPYSWG